MSVSSEILQNNNTKLNNINTNTIPAIQQIVDNLPDGSSLNIFIQTNEPSTKWGIWIKLSTFTYNSVVEIQDKNLTTANAINFYNKLNSLHRYKTFITDIIKYEFDGVYITDSNNEIIYGTEIFYGDGSHWLNCTSHYVGLSVNYQNGTTTRLGDTNVNNLDCYLDRRRCNLSNNGVVSAYYGDVDYSNIGNENLQVMVEQPIVFYKLANVVLESDNKSIVSCDYLVSDDPLPGYTLHPAFTDGTNVYNKVYANAFECTVINNKLSSVGGNTATPVASITRATARTYAHNRGANWEQLTIQYNELEKLLMLIELQTFDTRSALSVGVSNSGSFAKIGQGYYLNKNGTGLSGANISTSAPFTWRWRENPYGNMFKMNDGVNVYNFNWYIANKNFVDDTSENYIRATNTSTTTTGWITRFAYNDNAEWLFMPSKTSSSSDNFIKSHTWVGSSSSWTIVVTGGQKSDTSVCQEFTIGSDSASSRTETFISCGLTARFNS